MQQASNRQPPGSGPVLLSLGLPSLVTILCGGLAVALASAVTAVSAEPIPGEAPADASPSEEPRAALVEQLRRPAALALSGDERWLYVVNQRSGTLSVIDVESREVAAEHSLGGQLASLVPGKTADEWFTVDRQTHELLVVRAEGPRAEVLERIAVERHPISVAKWGDRGAVVASLWSRRLTFVQWDERGVSRVVSRLDLPWSPRELLVLPEGRLIVGEAFGGRLAVIDTGLEEQSQPEQDAISTRRASEAPESAIPPGVVGQLDLMKAPKLLHERLLPAHQIRGLAVAREGTMLVVAHQMLNELAHTVRNDVHWGLLMSNDLRWLRLDLVLQSEGDLYHGAHMHPLGEAGSATADPSALAMTADGVAVVALGGVGEIAVGRERDFGMRRIEVGRRPAAVTLDRAGERAFVANMFDDSVTIVDLKELAATATIVLGPSPPLTPADQGELLFYDGGLSHDRWMSCNSCHVDGHTNGQRNDNFSDKSFGAPKQVLSLLGKRGTEPFAWNGGAPDLGRQIRNSIMVTMQSDKEPRDEQVAALVAFLETLPAPPSLDEARGTRDESSIARGKGLFESQGCARCHAPPVYTTPERYDVGLEDELGQREFNPPSLLGVGQRGPYLHDGRAPRLEDVFREHRHQLDEPLDETALQDLLAFLRSL